VQPVLNVKCVSCHTHDRAANRVILTDDLTDQFSIGYQELLPYLSVANAMRWDHPDDVYARPPYTFGPGASRLTKLLQGRHHGGELTSGDWLRLVNWIDTNAVYYDRDESVYPRRQIFRGEARRKAEDAYSRRCASCHRQKPANDARAQETWWLGLNRRDVTLSRALKAPLRRAAGGWERCREPVFDSTADPEYQALLRALTAVRDALAQQPREDLLSLRGSEAECEQVILPDSPPPRPRP
jgi:hypothetical protein